MIKPRPRTRKVQKRTDAHSDLKRIVSKARGVTMKRHMAQNDIRGTAHFFKITKNNEKKIKNEENNPFIMALNGLKGIREYSPIGSRSKSRSKSLSRPDFLDLNQVKKIENIKSEKKIRNLINSNLNILTRLKGHYNPKSKRLSHRVEKPLKEIRPTKITRESVLERMLWK